MDIVEISLKDLPKERTIRSDTKFHAYYTNRIKRNRDKFVSLTDLVTIQQPKVDPSSISINEIKYVEISNTTQKGEINPVSFDNLKDVSEFERLSKKIEKGDIIKPESDSILISSVRPNLKKFVYVEEDFKDVYFTKAFICIRSNKIANKLLYYLLRSLLLESLIAISREGMAYPTLNEKDLKYLLIEKEIYEKILRVQKEIAKKIEKIEEQIKNEKQKLVPLQDIIERIFIEYGIKNTKFEKKEFEAFTTDAISIGNQKFLRCGPQYRAFWDAHKGLLFEDKARYTTVKLGSVMKLHKTKTLKKGILNKEYILLNLEDLEQFTGRLLNVNKLVSEIGSDKTLFSDADIIVSKIDPYLGYVSLNDQSKPLIGSTELLPYKVNKKLALPQYIKYLLLSHEYIFNSSLIMYGKRHPRIHPLDIVNIKVPVPDLETQRKMVNDIQKQETVNEEAEATIKRLRESIEKVIGDVLISSGNTG